MLSEKNEAKKRIEKLKAEINYHRYLYHVLDKEEISEGALDSLKNELYKLEMEFPDLITPDSPTQRIGGKALDKFQKVEHSSRMFSLFDTFSEQDMIEWETRITKLKSQSTNFRNQPFDYFCDLKLDGLAMNLRYENSIFIKGATRGDGLVGEDATNNLKTIETIPLKLNDVKEKELSEDFSKGQIKRILQVLKTGNIEVRGEAIMSKKTFNDLNKKYEKLGKAKLSNPRNGAAGSIRQLNPKVAAERKLDFYPYELATEMGLETQEQKMILLKLLGFKVMKESRYCKNLKEVEKFQNYWEKNRDSLPFEVDGVVAKVNKLALWEVLGMVGKGPRFMMAYKFAAEQATTKVLDVKWQVGRTGTLTPIAILKPVFVGGVTVSNSTLHNMDEITRLDLKIGDTVIVERAGDVIPKVVEVLSNLREGKEKKINIPEKCPVCGSKTEKVQGEVAYRCTNNECYAVNLRNLIHWASKNAVDIDGLGKKIVEQLMKEGLVSDVADFYTLEIGDLKPLERFADKSAENLIQAIKDKKEIELSRFIYALGIRHIGEESALLLAKIFSRNKLKETKNKQISIKQIIKYFQNTTLEELEEINDIGPVVAKSIYKWFRNEKNIKILEKLEDNGVYIRPQKIDNSQTKLAGKTFVLTGTLNNLTRDQAKAKIRELGGKISSSVSKKTDFVVAGTDPGSKYEKAKKLGVKVVDEEGLMDMLGG